MSEQQLSKFQIWRVLRKPQIKWSNLKKKRLRNLRVHKRGGKMADWEGCWVKMDWRIYIQASVKQRRGREPDEDLKKWRQSESRDGWGGFWARRHQQPKSGTSSISTKFVISLNPVGHSVLNDLALILRFYKVDKTDLRNMDEKH